MAKLNPYLNFGGNCEEAFGFYKSVFGGEFAMIMRFGEVPPGVPQTPGEENKIMHVSLPIGEGSMLMGSDAPAQYGAMTSGTNFCISVGTESREETERLYHGLSDGGKVEMPIGDMFWGAYFGMVRDKFGICWMISYDAPRA